MGLLSLGTPLPWPASLEFLEYIREHGITQFLHIYNANKDRKNDPFKWGDEIEYLLVKFDSANHTAKLSLSAPHHLEVLQKEEHEAKDASQLKSLWRPEYASFMLEGTPGNPYEGVSSLGEVENNMRTRRFIAENVLYKDEGLLAVGAFPRLGVGRFATPEHAPTPNGPVTQSLFFPDEAISPHPRFATLTANIRMRRGEKVAILVPVFRDVHTPQPFLDVGADTIADKWDVAEKIYMDAMGFGMGNNCLQVTMQAKDVEEAFSLYDQLAVVAPIFLALSASTPVFKGLLSDIDCRWTVISQSVDDRTAFERASPSSSSSLSQSLPLSSLPSTLRRHINKSRYDSIDCFISNAPEMKDAYNDLDLVFDHEIFLRLTADGVPERLARHIAHLFIRDPLVVFRETVELDDTLRSEHFENIQSTNWQTVRFKPPPPNAPLGWRVEFRPLEVQPTDFENAAFATFIVLLSRAILKNKLNFYMPISKVDENMATAHVRSAVTSQRFLFRRHVQGESADDSLGMFSMNELINGSKDGFVGLIPLVLQYLEENPISFTSRAVVDQYIHLLSLRASGELPTVATWIRSFVTAHPDYKHDSVVSERVSYDLLETIHSLSTTNLTSTKVPNLHLHAEQLFGKLSAFAVPYLHAGGFGQGSPLPSPPPQNLPCCSSQVQLKDSCAHNNDCCTVNGQCCC